jgi:hypothetical protein
LGEHDQEFPVTRLILTPHLLEPAGMGQRRPLQRRMDQPGRLAAEPLGQRRQVGRLAPHQDLHGAVQGVQQPREPGQQLLLFGWGAQPQIDRVGHTDQRPSCPGQLQHPICAQGADRAGESSQAGAGGAGPAGDGREAVGGDHPPARLPAPADAGQGQAIQGQPITPAQPDPNPGQRHRRRHHRGHREAQERLG